MPMKQILEATFNKAPTIMSQVHKFIKLMSHINWYKILIYYVHLSLYITVFKVLFNAAPSIKEYSAGAT